MTATPTSSLLGNIVFIQIAKDEYRPGLVTKQDPTSINIVYFTNGEDDREFLPIPEPYPVPVAVLYKGAQYGTAVGQYRKCVA